MAWYNIVIDLVFIKNFDILLFSGFLYQFYFLKYGIKMLFI